MRQPTKPATKFQVVTCIEGKFASVEFSTEEALIACMPALGGEFRGARLSADRTFREELYDRPKFSGFNGPMYNGPGVIRYGSPAAYAELSR